MEFVDRKEELEELERVLNRPSPSLVVLYGRRRLGKSTLIKKALRENDVFYMAGDFVNNVQISLLKQQLSYKFPEIENLEFPDWGELFKLINTLTEKKFTLCLDEFPYLVKHSPELPSVLQKIIDSKELRFNIIICGSSQRMMQKIVLSGSEPLYGRANSIIRLQPLPIQYMGEALKLDPDKVIEEYSVWGGVPRYWEIREEYSNLKDTLLHTLLTPIGVLYDEPNRLFLDELSSAVQSESLMSVIAGGAHRLSEIGSRMGRDATALTLPLDRLIRMNYLRREIPFGENPKKTKRGLYKISDPFMKFYYTFIIPNISNIVRGRKNFVADLIELHFADYVSSFWEYICCESVSGNSIFGKQWKEASRWWGSVAIGNSTKQMEVDLIAESMDGSSIMVGECKWTNPEVSGILLKKLKQKATLLPFCKDKEIIPVLFLKNKPKDYDGTDQHRLFYPEDIIRLSYGDT